MNRTSARAGERGQVLPLWALGSITTFALMFLAINYANAVRYQIRAQNAADSAATALVAIQSQRFNLMNVALYNANVEEYRLRRTLDGLLLSTAFSGGCAANINFNTVYTEIDITPGLPPAGSCSAAYENLRFFYLKSFNRYTADVVALNNITNDLSFKNHFTPDAKDLLAQLGRGSPQCLTPPKAVAGVTSSTVGDCAMTYGIVELSQRTQLLAVEQNVGNLLVPGLGNHSQTKGVDTENQDLLAPVQVDITTCDAIPPIIPNFGPIHLATTYAIGRAAAADVMVEEDWLDPGRIDDPVRAANEPFQGIESYTTTSAAASNDPGATYDWYGVDFGGNDSYAYPKSGYFSSTLGRDELSVRVGWWSAIPIRPFYPTPLTTAGQCPAA